MEVIKQFSNEGPASHFQDNSGLFTIKEMHFIATTLSQSVARCQLLRVLGFREARVTEREDQTRATDQQGKTTTEATDQGSDQGLHVGFVDAELQQKNNHNTNELGHIQF